MEEKRKRKRNVKRLLILLIVLCIILISLNYGDKGDYINFFKHLLKNMVRGII